VCGCAGRTGLYSRTTQTITIQVAVENIGSRPIPNAALTTDLHRRAIEPAPTVRPLQWIAISLVVAYLIPPLRKAIGHLGPQNTSDNSA
jgi:hypothetical protein